MWAVAMGGGPFYMTAPKVIGVELKGKLQPWVAPKDVIFRVLSILTTKGNVSCIVEYFGEGVKSLAVPDRATITNMGAELGVTTSIFPADAMTKKYLKAQGREEQYKAMAADRNPQFDRISKKMHIEKDKGFLENIRKYCVGRGDEHAGQGWLREGFVRPDRDRPVRTGAAGGSTGLAPTTSRRPARTAARRSTR